MNKSSMNGKTREENIRVTSAPQLTRDFDGDGSEQRDSLTRSSAGTHSRHSQRTSKRKGSEWEILGNLEKGVSYTIKPKKHEGYLYKRRKWPLKGWHKRYFLIEQGFFTYAKSEADLHRGRTLGRFNIGVAVISANYAEMRIDIDAEESVHHVKLDTMEVFGLFLEQLQQHRLYVQHQTNCSASAPDPDCVSPVSQLGPASLTFSSHRNSLLRGGAGGGARAGRAAVLAEMAAQDEQLTGHVQRINTQLGQLMDTLGRLEAEGGEQSSSAMKKLLKLRKKKSNGGTVSGRAATTDRASPVDGEGELVSTLTSMAALSTSNPSLASLSLGRPTSLSGLDPPAQHGAAAISRPVSIGGCAAGAAAAPGREEAVNMAIDIQADLATMQKEYLGKRDQVRQLLEADSKGSSLQPSMAMMASLRQSLRAAQEQNQALRARLARIHAEADTSDLPPVVSMPEVATLPRGMNNALSFSSSCMSEFFDAREYINSGEDSEDEEVEDCESDASKSDTEDEQTFHEAMSIKDTSSLEVTGTISERFGESVQNTAISAPGQGIVDTFTGRRRDLPVPITEMEGVNLWNLLCKNIGKDLSKISMPVTLNEPLSTLQRLCEELEYSDLLDKAAAATSPLDRMVWVAAFAISAYGSTNARASHKPFNPLLGETYECVREDKGFRYIAEQVSHHPPVSCAQATGADWCWSQALRIRSKFWGKSMEFQPEGKINLALRGHGEEYTWNKVTSCIHNILGQERWVDLYGECVITCPQSGLTARIQFVKASYWSNKRHEMFGTITDAGAGGAVVTNMFGKWSEALYIGKAPSARCIWRPGSLPEEAQLYYGFSRFAIELNEVTAVEKEKIPPTDARYRPDQRALEEGRFAEAENVKLGLEQAQRDRKRQRDHGQLEPYTPLWFHYDGDDGEDPDSQDSGAVSEKWKFGEKYWDSRNNGFQNVAFEPVW